MAAALLLAGCGFAPAYGPGAPARQLLEQVRVDDPVDRQGFDLVERLEERLGRAQTPAYALAYVITTESFGVAISPENAITRFNLAGKVGFTLRDLANGTALASGSVNTFTSYAASGSTVSTLSAERDATQRLMRLLADQIVTRLIATAPEWAQ